MSTSVLGGCFLKVLSSGVLLSTNNYSFQLSVRQHFFLPRRKRQLCINCMLLQLSQLVASKKHVSTSSHIIPPVLYSKEYLSSGLSKSQYRYISDQQIPTRKNKWDDKAHNFTESENEYFHSYLASSAEYRPYLLSALSRKETCVLPVETVSALLQEVQREKKVGNLLLLLSHWCGMAGVETGSVLSNDFFSKTVRLLRKHVNQLTIEDVLESMAKLDRLGFRHSLLSFSEPRKNRILVSKTFDQVCSKRLKRFDIKELLLAADFFYSVRGSPFTDFPYLMCERMKFFLPKTTKPELVLLLFHISMIRKSPPNLTTAVLDRLNSHMDSLTLQELGIINLAHYKTRSHVRQPAFFTALTKKLQTASSFDVDPICLSAVLKYQQKSLNKCKDMFVPEFFATMRGLEEPLLSRIPTLPSETLMHVLNLYYSLDLLSEDLFMAVIHRVVLQGLGDWRVKDIARVTHILTNIPLGLEGKMEAMAAVLMELGSGGRQAERRDHPGCMLQVAVALTYCGVYPHWLVEELFSHSAQRHFKGSDIDYRRDLFHLSESVSIEDGTYGGPLMWADNFPRLSSNKLYSKLLPACGYRKMKGGITKMASSAVMPGNGLFARDWMLVDLVKVLHKTHPQHTALPTFLLSHFQTADVEIRARPEREKDATAQRQACLTRWEEVSEAVVLHASNAYQTVRCHGGHTTPLLRQYHAMRARQLRTLGATVVEIPYFEFEASADKDLFVQTKLREEKTKRGLQPD